MQSFILQGTSDQQNEYIHSFTAEKRIPVYLIQRFEVFKIADARVLQKTLAVKLPEGSSRLIIVSSPTTEAQNAILKTIEELSGSNFVFFCVENVEDVLPTILSRSTVLKLGIPEKGGRFTVPLEKLFSSAPTEKERLTLEFINSLGEIEKETIDDVMVSLCALLKNSLGKHYAAEVLAVLKTLSGNLFLTTSYNVQKKLFMENVFLNPDFFLKKNNL
ncbi:MAG: hypothetical protein ACM3IJ_00455 [Candidatus Levyibacteriota bacterium]